MAAASADVLRGGSGAIPTGCCGNNPGEVLLPLIAGDSLALGTAEGRVLWEEWSGTGSCVAEGGLTPELADRVAPAPVDAADDAAADAAYCWWYCCCCCIMQKAA